MSVDEGLLHAWLDGQLAAEDAARVERLVAEDPAWGAAAAEARGLIAASSRILGALDTAPSLRHAVGRTAPLGQGAGGTAAVPDVRDMRGGGRRLAPWMRIAAGLVLAVGVGAVVWDSQRSVWVEPALVDAPLASTADSVVPATVTTAESAVDAPRPKAAPSPVTPPSPAEAPVTASAEKSVARATEVPPAAVADFAGRGVAGGSVAPRLLAEQRSVLCYAVIGTAGVVDTATRVVVTALTVEPDSSARAEWTEAAGRAVLQGRQVGDTLRGVVRISAGDIRLPLQERVLLRVPCR